MMLGDGNVWRVACGVWWVVVVCDMWCVVGVVCCVVCGVWRVAVAVAMLSWWWWWRSLWWRSCGKDGGGLCSCGCASNAGSLPSPLSPP